jgi:hypothetical protein
MTPEQKAAANFTPEQKAAMSEQAAANLTPEQKAAMLGELDEGTNDDDFSFEAMAGDVMKDLGINMTDFSKVGPEHGDKCKGFEKMLAMDKQAEKCWAHSWGESGNARARRCTDANPSVIAYGKANGFTVTGCSDPTTLAYCDDSGVASLCCASCAGGGGGTTSIQVVPGGDDFGYTPPSATELTKIQAACKADTSCEWNEYESECNPNDKATQKIVGVSFDEAAIEKEFEALKTKEEQKALAIKKFNALIPAINDFNATMEDVKKFMAKCGKFTSAAACNADDVCEYDMEFKGDTDEMVETCKVNPPKAVATLKCPDMDKAFAEADANKKKKVAKQAKKVLAGKEAKQKTAKKEVEEYKKKNPNAKPDTDATLRKLVEKETAATTAVQTASARVSTADTTAKAAKTKASSTPDDKSTPASALRVLPSVVAIVAATVAAAFA